MMFSYEQWRGNYMVTQVPWFSELEFLLKWNHYKKIVCVSLASYIKYMTKRLHAFKTIQIPVEILKKRLMCIVYQLITLCWNVCILLNAD